MISFYLVVRYTGSRNLQTQHWRWLRDAWETKRFLRLLQLAARQRPDQFPLKPGDFKVDNPDAPRAWLIGFRVHDQFVLDEVTADRVRIWAEGVDLGQYVTIGEALNVAAFRVAVEYGFSPPDGYGVFQLARQILQYELRDAAADVLAVLQLPLAERTDFTITAADSWRQGDALSRSEWWAGVGFGQEV